MASHRHTAWRLSLRWHGAVLDTATVAGPHDTTRTITLRTGDRFDVTVVDDLDTGSAEGDRHGGAVVVAGAKVRAVLRAGQRLELPAGHELVATIEPAPAAALRDSLAIDSTLLHATMIAFAAVTVVVSAFWFAPVDVVGDPGGGIPADARRWLSLSGGTAPTVGRPSVDVGGRVVDLGERVDVLRREGTTNAVPDVKAPPRPSLDRTLAAMQQALQRGSDGDTDRDPIGTLSRAVAAAPVLGAGVGGLSPRDPVDNGVGSGVIGAGDALRQQALRRREQAEAERALPARTWSSTPNADVPDAAVDDDGGLAAKPELDPLVREHLTRMIRVRHNVVRACYEAWGLARDAHRAGRIVLELTLRPDGRVEQLSTMTSTPELERVGHCIERAAGEWYLGDGLVDAPTRLAFPFNLQPRG